MLYQITCDKEAIVADLMVRSYGAVHWNVGFSRAAQDWELDMFADFFDSLYAMSIGNEMRDRLLWNPSGNKNFSVRSFYKALLGFSNDHSYPWKCKVPSKIAFFV